jgi:SAM-dependent methyltransferase
VVPDVRRRGSARIVRILTEPRRSGIVSAPHLSSAAVQEVREVRAFWERGACGETYAAGETLREQMDAQAAARYALEPFIHAFADFPSARGRDVLEIGVGMGADHLEWAKAAPRSLTGIDLTERAVEHTRRRLALRGLRSDVFVGDAERLPFPDDSFDVVYSWGVLHHSPRTEVAVAEVLRVLRPGGVARVMIYHKHSVVGWLLWLRYALLAGRPRRSLEEVYAEHLESPGTKAYTPAGAARLFAGFREFSARVELSCGDLMEGAAGQRHRGVLLALARRVWPRSLIRRVLKRRGLFLLIEARR